MKRTHFTALLIGLAAICIFANDASAYYDPGTGRFLSRDPGLGGAMGTPQIATGGPAVGGGFLPRDPIGTAYPPVGQIALGTNTGPVRVGGVAAPQPRGRTIKRDQIANSIIHLPPANVSSPDPTSNTPYADGMNLYQYVYSNPLSYVDPSGLAGLCICCFKGSTGKLYIDSSCAGILRIWVIDEGSAPASGGTSGSWFSADGFVLSGTTYKIDGSTCNKLKCTATTMIIESCVNLAAKMMGKKPPYSVPSGTFGGPPKEPTPGSTPPLVK